MLSLKRGRIVKTDFLLFQDRSMDVEDALGGRVELNLLATEK